MRVVRGIANLPPLPQGCVATIGTFDGVHRGHQALIHNLAAEGQRRGLPVAVVLFEPQPREFFQPYQAPARLCRWREKMAALAALPIDYVLTLRFDQALADLPADTFVQRLLIDGLKTHYLVVGDDFRFGQGRLGDFNLLRKLGAYAGFQVTDTPTYTLEGQRISSTWVRTALRNGDCALATRLLGRPYSLSGRVIHGNQNGRRLGYPTANLALRRPHLPLSGVFAVTVSGLGATVLPGVANVGVRPTLQGDELAVLEVHVFDFQQDLYRQPLTVNFHAKLRDERRFPSLDALRLQIERDALAAREWLLRGQL